MRIFLVTKLIALAIALPAFADPIVTDLEDPYARSAQTAKEDGCRLVAVRFDYSDSSKTDVTICPVDKECEKYVTIHHSNQLQSHTDLGIQAFKGRGHVLNYTTFNSLGDRSITSSRCRADKALAKLKSLF